MSSKASATDKQKKINILISSFFWGGEVDFSGAYQTLRVRHGQVGNIL